MRYVRYDAGKHQACRMRVRARAARLRPLALRCCPRNYSGRRSAHRPSVATVRGRHVARRQEAHGGEGLIDTAARPQAALAALAGKLGAEYQPLPHGDGRGISRALAGRFAA